MRLSGHYMHHLFARCYCLHGGDFIRCCDNFINLGEIRFFPREGENGEAKGGGSETTLHWQDGGGIHHRGITEHNRHGRAILLYFNEICPAQATCSPVGKWKPAGMTCWIVTDKSLDLLAMRLIFLPAPVWIQIFKLRVVRWYQMYPVSGAYCAHRVGWITVGFERREIVLKRHGHMVNGVSLKAQDEGWWPSLITLVTYRSSSSVCSVKGEHTRRNPVSSSFPKTLAQIERHLW